MDDILSVATSVLHAVRGGQGFLAAALVLVFLVAVAKRYGAAKYPWLNSDIGGTALTLAGSFGGMTATALAAGSAPSWALAWTALGVAVTAAGGYSMIKKLGAPLLRALEVKVPILKPVLDLVLWMFEKPDAVAKATAAGAAAVAAKPAPGAAGIVGEPDDLS